MGLWAEIRQPEPRKPDFGHPEEQLSGLHKDLNGAIRRVGNLGHTFDFDSPTNSSIAFSCFQLLHYRSTLLLIKGMNKGSLCDGLRISAKPNHKRQVVGRVAETF